MLASRWATSPAAPETQTATPAVNVTGQKDGVIAPGAAMVDEFAQTREDDDLFDDDFTPVPEPVIEPVSSSSVSGTGAAVPVVAAATAAVSDMSHSATKQQRPPHRGAARSAMRGRSGRDRARGGGLLMASQHASDNAKLASAHRRELNGEGMMVAEGGERAEATGPQTPPPPKGPRKDGGGVRGDRSATGGLNKPKLTDEELKTRMSAIKAKNATLTAAHVRAEADQARFEEREAVAAKKARARARQDDQNRQQMIGERESNRQRKLKAAQGREWDAGKEDAVRGGTATPDDNDDVRGRSTNAQGRTRANGSRRAGPRSAVLTQQRPPRAAADFPKLPTAPMPNVAPTAVTSVGLDKNCTVSVDCDTAPASHGIAIEAGDAEHSQKKSWADLVDE